MSSSAQSSNPTIQYSDWPAGAGTTILTTVSGQDDFLEPSGLTVYTDGDNVQWFYLASDNGRIARRRADLSDDWVSESFYDDDHPKQSDFESICVAKGKLMVGVEGGAPDGDPTHAHIKRFNPSSDTDNVGAFSKSWWNLKDVNPSTNAGMEAMTFVPDGCYPASWLPASQNGESLYYGGVFLVAFQSVPGTIYVYDLPEGNDEEHDVNSVYQFTTGLQSSRKLSDLCYDASHHMLYALYDDDANSQDILQELQLNSNGVSLLYQTKPPYYGCEAVAIKGSTLYLGIDQNATQWTNNGGSGDLTNYVYKFGNYTSHS